MSDTELKKFLDTLYVYDQAGGYVPMELFPDDFKKLAALVAQREALAEKRGRETEHADFKRYAERFGFEHLETTVEYQDGSSADIPYRHHWNDCYDKFTVASKARVNELNGLNPYGEPFAALTTEATQGEKEEEE